jgi:hypothetical protein
MIGSVTMSDDAPTTERVANVVQGTLTKHSRACRFAPTTISVIWISLTRHLRRRGDSSTLWNHSLCSGALSLFEEPLKQLTVAAFRLAELRTTFKNSPSPELSATCSRPSIRADASK